MPCGDCDLADDLVDSARQIVILRYALIDVEGFLADLAEDGHRDARAILMKVKKALLLAQDKELK